MAKEANDVEVGIPGLDLTDHIIARNLYLWSRIQQNRIICSNRDIQKLRPVRKQSGEYSQSQKKRQWIQSRHGIKVKLELSFNWCPSHPLNQASTSIVTGQVQSLKQWESSLVMASEIRSPNI